MHTDTDTNMLIQVTSFIDSTSGFPGKVNDNLYYYNTFSSIVVGSTGSFMTNDGGQVSDAAQTVVQAASGATNIVAGMQDLEAAFTAAGATGGVF